MKILGIHDGHNASACLMVDGEIKMLIQEERITREKNKNCFPHESIKLILEKNKFEISDIDAIGMNGTYMPKPLNRQETLDGYKKLLEKKMFFNSSVLRNRIKSVPIVSQFHEKRNMAKRINQLEAIGVNAKQIHFVDHHTLHASAAYFGQGEYSDEILVLTNDGAGDRLCATVNIFKGGKMERIASIHENHSIGILYGIFTFLTGMVPLEHEYKIMGMAPYAHKAGAQKVAKEFWDMFEFSPEGLTWKFKKGFSVFGSMNFFKEFMFLKRFDYLMAGLQIFTEEFLVHWVRSCIKQTGIHKLALSGGTFMNVKADKFIMELPEVERVFLFPSCGDESNSAGACYYLQSKLGSFKSISKLEDVYFGVEYSNEEIVESFDNFSFKNNYKISFDSNIECVVAKLLSENNVVARFKGREEFGARSLGNRAIIANPNNPDVIKEINSMIKNRDFWMPFACSILDEGFENYVLSEGKNDPYYMIMTFDTRSAATELMGGIHPYDRTVRPQLVTRKHNHDYWVLINEFKRITGIGGVLNTSLNLHGLPLVHSPEDAFHVLENSELRFLAIGDYLIEKVN